jgi:hypothetical protein
MRSAAICGPRIGLPPLLDKARELSSEIGICRKHFAQANECAHDFDIDENHAPAAQDAGKHGYTLLGLVARAPIAFRIRNITHVAREPSLPYS